MSINVIVSAGGGGGGGGGFTAGVSSGGNSAGTTGMVGSQLRLYGGSNITLSGSVNGDSATVSFIGPATTSGIFIYDPAIPAVSSFGTAVFVNSNGVSFGFTGDGAGQVSVTASVQTNYLTNINVSAGSTSNNLSKVTFSNSNGVSFGLNGSTITATVKTDYQTSGAYLTTAMASDAVTISNINISAGTTSNNLSKLTFSNGNGVSFGLNGSTITASVAAAGGAQTGISGLIVSDATYTSGTVSFSNAGNITISSSVNGASQYIRLSVAAQSNQTVGLYASSNTYLTSSGTQDARSLSFRGDKSITVGISAGEVVFSVGAYLTTAMLSNAATISNINISAGTTSNNLSAIVLSNSNAISFGLNGSTLTGSVTKGTVNAYAYPNGIPWQTAFSLSNMSFSLQQIAVPFYATASQINLLMSLSGNSDSSGALTISLGLYSMAGSTLSLASSDSRQLTWTSGSQTSASSRYGGVSGVRYRTLAVNNWAVTPGEYIMGMWYRTTNDGTWRHYGRQGPTIVGAVDGNETGHYLDGFSTSSFSTAMPASINVTDTNYVRTGGDAGKQPGLIFLGSF